VISISISISISIPLALGAAVGACSFIDNFPDVAPDPVATSGTISAGTGGAATTSGPSMAEGGAASSTSSSSSSSSSSESVGAATGSGGSDGACVPSFELCATPADENCDHLGCVGRGLAAASFGGLGEQRGRSITAAGSDAILLSTALGAINPGGGALLELGDVQIADLVLARYSPSLSALWQRRFADSALGGVVVSAGGDVLLAAGSTGDVDFGGGPLKSAGNASQDVTVARLDASGKHLWSHRWGDAADQFANAVAVDAQGDAILTGGYAGALAIGPGAPLASASALSIFLAKLDAAGAPIWSKSFGSLTTPAVGTSVAVDSAGDILLAGYFRGTLDLGGPSLVSQGDADVFVAKLDAAGTPLWSLAFGGTGADRSFSVAVDQAGAVFVAGAFHGLVTFGALPPISSPSLNDLSGFLVKISPSGTPLWVRSQSDPAGMAAGTDQIAYDVAVDAEGNAVLTGAATGTTVFDPASPVASARVAAGAADAFVAKYDPQGALLWAKLLGDASPQVGVSIALGPLGAVWSTGYFTGSLTVDATPPVTLVSAGGVDVFLARLSP
jgi:hypothetical protein